MQQRGRPKKDFGLLPSFRRKALFAQGIIQLLYYNKRWSKANFKLSRFHRGAQLYGYILLLHPRSILCTFSDAVKSEN
jgi:hypothetical protein